jgi:antitoxin VapB
LRAPRSDAADSCKNGGESRLDRATAAIPLRDRFAALRAAHPLAAPAGALADKAFFDGLSGEP